MPYFMAIGHTYTLPEPVGDDGFAVAQYGCVVERYGHDGSMVWSATVCDDTEDASSPPVISRIMDADGVVVAEVSGPARLSLMALDSDTGTAVWERSFKLDPSRVQTAYDGAGHVLAGFWDDVPSGDGPFPLLYTLEIMDAGTGQSTASVNVLPTLSSAPVQTLLYADHMLALVTDGNLYRISYGSDSPDAMWTSDSTFMRVVTSQDGSWVYALGRVPDASTIAVFRITEDATAPVHLADFKPGERDPDDGAFYGMAAWGASDDGALFAWHHVPTDATEISEAEIIGTAPDGSADGYLALERYGTDGKRWVVAAFPWFFDRCMSTFGAVGTVRSDMGAFLVIEPAAVCGDTFRSRAPYAFILWRDSETGP